MAQLCMHLGGVGKVAKRFTDTGKWKRQWFRALSLEAKVLWQYLIDECDHVGIWVADFELASFQVSFDVDEEKLAKLLGDKIVKLDTDKYFIPSFFEFQYADAKDGFKAKQSALKVLRSWNLLDESDSLIDLSNSYLSVTGQSPDCTSKIKSKIKSKSKSKKGMQGETYTPEFEANWKLYPRKDDKSDAFRAYQANVGPDEHGKVPEAIARYLAKLKRDGTDAKYIKLGATFFGKRRWADCLDPDYGSAESFGDQSSDLNPDDFKIPGGAA